MPVVREVTPCPRCHEAACLGRFAILSCKAVLDGKNVVDEAIEMLDGRYRTPVSVRSVLPRPELMRCRHSDEVVVPWEPDKDRRPRARGGPRVGMKRPFSHGPPGAAHGECTMCVSEGGPTAAATWRRQHGDRFVYSRASLCDRHAYLVAGPEIVVPEFENPDDAVAWLDQLTDELYGQAVG